jgi:hypothetical protein
MAWPDGPVRWQYGSMCNGHAAFHNPAFPFVGYAFTAWDLAEYAKRLGPEGVVPDAERNVAFAKEAAERHAGRAPRGLLQVSERRLRDEMARLDGELVVYLGWPINVTDASEPLRARMRRFCARNLEMGSDGVARAQRRSSSGELQRPDLAPLRELPEAASG